MSNIGTVIWDTVNEIRDVVAPTEYKHIVLNFLFLKIISDKYQARKQQLVGQGREDDVDDKDAYYEMGVFVPPENARWDYIINTVNSTNVVTVIEDAFESIEAENEVLKGALPKGYFKRLLIDKSKLVEVLRRINKAQDWNNVEEDIIGEAYEYLLKKFAFDEAKQKGSYYTPACLVKLIVELIEPFKGKVYDPCFGSGGMFVQSIKFIREHDGKDGEISIYGQELEPYIHRLARINLAIRGVLRHDFGEKAACTFKEDQHKDLKVDYIMANPPFNLKRWSDEAIKDDPRFKDWPLLPKGNANYAWILHMISKLNKDGVAGFLLANGALDDENTQKIRKKLIEDDLVEAIIVIPRGLFYATDASATLWILNKNKKEYIGEFREKREYRDRSHQVLFIDLRFRDCTQWINQQKELTADAIKAVKDLFFSWRLKNKGEYTNIEEYCYSATKDEIEKCNHSLLPCNYIKFVWKNNPKDKEKILTLSKEIETLANQEQELRTKINNLLSKFKLDREF